MKILGSFFIIFNLIIFLSFDLIVNAQNIIDLNDKSVQTDDTSKALSEDEKLELSQKDRPVDISDNSKIKIYLSQETQNPQNKNVEFVLQYQSIIDSDRLKITWEVKGVSINITTQKSDTYTVQAGKTYTNSFVVQPLGNGISEIFVTVELFEANARNLATARKIYQSNSAGEILPYSEEYKSNKFANDIKNTIVRIVVFFGGGSFLFFLIKKLKDWYSMDDIKKFEESYKNLK